MIRGSAPPGGTGTQDIAKIRRVFVLQFNDTSEMPAALDLYLYQ